MHAHSGDSYSTFLDISQSRKHKQTDCLTTGPMKSLQPGTKFDGTSALLHHDTNTEMESTSNHHNCNSCCQHLNFSQSSSEQNIAPDTSSHLSEPFSISTRTISSLGTKVDKDAIYNTPQYSSWLTEPNSTSYEALHDIIISSISNLDLSLYTTIGIPPNSTSVKNTGISQNFCQRDVTCEELFASQCQRSFFQQRALASPITNSLTEARTKGVISKNQTPGNRNNQLLSFSNRSYPSKSKKFIFTGIFTLAGFPTFALASLDNYINQQLHNQHHHQAGSENKNSAAEPVPSLKTPSGTASTISSANAKQGSSHNRLQYSNPQHHPNHRQGISENLSYNQSNPSQGFQTSSITVIISVILFATVFFWIIQKRSSKKKSRVATSYSSSNYSSYKSRKGKKSTSRNKSSSKSALSSSSSAQSPTNSLLADNEYVHSKNVISFHQYFIHTFLPSFIVNFFYSSQVLKLSDTARFIFAMVSDTVYGTAEMVSSSARQITDAAMDTASSAVEGISDMFSGLTTNSDSLEGEELIDLNAETFEDEDDEDSEDSEESEESESDELTQEVGNIETPVESGTSALSETNLADASVAKEADSTVLDEKKAKKLRKQSKAARKKALEKQLKVSKMGGLYNEGNTCFMNSIVQSLGSLDSIDVLLDNIGNQSADGNVPIDCMPRASLALRHLIHQINTKSLHRHTYSANDLVRSMGKSSSRWMSSDQEDAQEYFQQVLDFLERDTKALSNLKKAELEAESKNKNEKSEKEEEKPRLITPFDGETAIRVGCLKCGETEGLRPEVVSSVGLSLESTMKDTNLHALLREFTHLEVIPGVECYRCSLKNMEKNLEELLGPKIDKDGNVATPDSRLHDLMGKRLDLIREALKQPIIDEKKYKEFQAKSKKELGDKSKQVMFARPTAKVIPIHINRSVFDYRTGYTRKNLALVAFPEVLDISPYVVADVKDKRNLDPKIPMIPVSSPNHELDTTDDEFEDIEEEEEEEFSPEVTADSKIDETSGLPTPDASPRADSHSDDDSEPKLNGNANNGSVLNGVVNGHVDSKHHEDTAHVPNPDSLIYNLKAVVVHYGSHNFGHYICYRKCRHGLWWKISDQNVNQVDIDQVLEAQGAFMLFYEHEYEGKLRKTRLKEEKLRLEAESKLRAAEEAKNPTPEKTEESANEYDETEESAEAKSGLIDEANEALNAEHDDDDDNNDEDEEEDEDDEESVIGEQETEEEDLVVEGEPAAIATGVSNGSKSTNRKRKNSKRSNNRKR